MSSISSMLDFESFSLISSPSRVDYLDSVCNQTSKQHFLHLDYEKIQIVGKGMSNYTCHQLLLSS